MYSFNIEAELNSINYIETQNKQTNKHKEIIGLFNKIVRFYS